MFFLLILLDEGRIRILIQIRIRILEVQNHPISTDPDQQHCLDLLLNWHCIQFLISSYFWFCAGKSCKPATRRRWTSTSSTTTSTTLLTSAPPALCPSTGGQSARPRPSHRYGNQYCESMTFWCGSESGSRSTDPYL
jgi:hypothetical protein